MAINTTSPTDLRARVTGTVIAPDDAAYDEARKVLTPVDRHPAAIVRPVDAADVQRVVDYARENDLLLAVRSGGHSGAGHGTCDDGIVLDLADMKGLEIDAEAKTAWAEAGLTAGEYTTQAAERGLATGFGDTASVGIGGITTGGGIGYLVRKFGMTIDNLLAAEIVTADGELRQVDATSDPDLFWAIRGGGGNFGVVTRFKYRLADVPGIVGGVLIQPATAEVIAGHVAAVEAAPEELSTILNVMPCPPMPFVPEEYHGQVVAMSLICWAGDTEEGQRVLAPIRALAEPLADLVRPMSYAEIYPPDEGHPQDPPRAVARTMFVDHVDRDVAQTILGSLAASTAMMPAAQLRVLGGAMARVADDATAFAHRDARILVNLAAIHAPTDDAAVHTAWVEAFMATLRQGEDGAYVNFLADEPHRIRAAYPDATYERLAQLKGRYDPTNLFRLNQNIEPARAG